MRTADDKIVLSASRRTDIPAFYLDWFLDRLARGFFETVNPFNQKKRVISADPRHVHGIVFWSKDYGRFLADPIGEELQERGYHLFFNFTLNSDSEMLEPNIPDLPLRLEQLQSLAQRFGPDRIHWRFDPVCFYQNEAGRMETNLADFPRIAEFAAACGIQRCVTSMLDLYPKLRRRRHAPDFIDPPPGKKQQVLLEMERRLRAHKIQLLACCEKDLLEGLPSTSCLAPSACIPSDLLVALSGRNEISLRKDAGQRRRQGCGCGVSVDVGDYRRHPCAHGCRYCYANPVGCG